MNIQNFFEPEKKELKDFLRFDSDYLEKIRLSKNIKPDIDLKNDIPHIFQLDRNDYFFGKIHCDRKLFPLKVKILLTTVTIINLFV